MKLSIILITAITACLLTISSLYDDGTMILESLAEEYSVCDNVNACSDEDLAKMTDLLLEQDDYNSRIWLRVILGWEHWLNRVTPNSSARDVSPARHGGQ